MTSTEYELVVFDADETLIDGDIIRTLGEYAGVIDELHRCQERVWQGELEAMDALSNHIFPLFEGIPLAEVERLAASLPYAPGAKAVAQNVTCRTAVFTALLPLADRIADELELDYRRANEPVAADNVLTGDIRGDIVAQGKGPVLDALVASLGIDHDQVIVLGDGPQDRPLFTRAGFSIGVDPKPAVRDVPDVVLPEQDLSLAAPYLHDQGVLPADALESSDSEI